ncbi:MAG: hypothetical protein WAL24_03250 [Nitrososphaeraceae archaeon]
MWVAGYDKLFAIGETISSSNFRSCVAFKEVGKVICGISRPTRILIYIAKIKIIKIQVRKIIPVLRVRFIMVRTIDRNNRVEVSPENDK